MSSSEEQKTYLESIAKEVLSKYRRPDSVLTHSPSIGNYHERILRNVIKEYLPNSFNVGEGFIINNNGDASHQIDTLVVDSLDPRSYVYKEKGFFIVSNIAVVNFSEVKTYCNKNDFIKSFHKLIRTSLLLGDDHSSRATSFIFCYDARVSAETFKSWPDNAISKLENMMLLTRGIIQILSFA